MGPDLHFSLQVGFMREKSIETRLREKCRDAGAMCLKLEPTSMAGLPDRIVLQAGRVWFVELKAPGQSPRPIQLLAHDQLRKCGFEVYVIDSRELVDWFIREVLNG